MVAAEDGGRESRQAQGRVAWFVYTSMPEGVENPVNVMTGKEIIQLTLSKRSASEAVKVPADGILRLVRAAADPQNPKKTIYLTLAQANIPDSVAKALVILAPAAPGKGDLLFHTKVQDLATFKGGDYLYLNLTTLNIGVELGTVKMEIKPGETRIYDARNLDKSTNVPVKYSFYQPIEKSWNLLSASTVVLRPTRREICIFNWDSRFNRVDYHGITFAPDNPSRPAP